MPLNRQRAKWTWLRPGLTIAGSIASVAALTAIDFRFAHFNSATTGFTYLVLVLALATRVGKKEALIACLASVFSYNYFFLPPVGTFTISDPQNWVALLAFLVTALTTSHLSASARRQAFEAERRQIELQRMYEFSRALMLHDDRTLTTQTVQQLSAIFNLTHVFLFDAPDGNIVEGRGRVSDGMESTLRRVALSGSSWSSDGGRTRVVPLILGGRSQGSLAIQNSSDPSDVALQALAQLIAIAMERSRAQTAANHLQATRENERLKSTLLDALAHEFKTPLTSVKAAATTLLAHRNGDALYQELLTVIDEESDRLITLVNDAIELARIDISEVDLQKEVCSPAELVRAATAELHQLLDERPVHILIDDHAEPILADSRLMQLVLRQLLINAIRYSPTGSPITLRVEKRDSETLFRVRNTGYGVPRSEQNLIFDKFYRGKQVRGRTAGTGMGLSIAREIIEAHGGQIWVESEMNEGAELFFTLPAAVPAEAPVKARER